MEFVVISVAVAMFGGFGLACLFFAAGFVGIILAAVGGIVYGSYKILAEPFMRIPKVPPKRTRRRTI